MQSSKSKALSSKRPCNKDNGKKTRLVAKTNIEREEGYFYFIGKRDPKKSTQSVFRRPLGDKTASGTKMACFDKLSEDEYKRGLLYLGKDGNVYQAMRPTRSSKK